jgi:hypothetical protein
LNTIVDRLASLHGPSWSGTWPQWLHSLISLHSKKLKDLPSAIDVLEPIVTRAGNTWPRKG